MGDEQETEEDIQYQDDTHVDEAQIEIPDEQYAELEGYRVAEEAAEQTRAFENERPLQNIVSIGGDEDRSSFIHGLAVGLGIGCISTFIIMWITVFFSPRLPSGITYEGLLTIFIYPLIYLLTVGLIALTAGIVREYYTRSHNY